MPYDESAPTSNRDQVRLLISDTDTSDHIFEDGEIDQFLSIADSNIYRAAALGLRTIAGNEVQVQKRIRLLDLDTDGPAVSRELRQLANEYDQRASEQGTFQVAEFSLRPFGRQQRIRRQVKRNRL